MEFQQFNFDDTDAFLASLTGTSSSDNSPDALFNDSWGQTMNFEEPATSAPSFGGATDDLFGLKALPVSNVPATRSGSSVDESEDDLKNLLKGAVKKKDRTAHNKIEKKYRTNINSKIEDLRDAVPTLRILNDGAHVSIEELEGLAPATKLNKASILSKATEYIYHLQRKNDVLIKENVQLRDIMARYGVPPPNMSNYSVESMIPTPEKTFQGMTTQNKVLVGGMAAVLGTSFLEDQTMDFKGMSAIPYWPLFKMMLALMGVVCVIFPQLLAARDKKKRMPWDELGNAFWKSCLCKAGALEYSKDDGNVATMINQELFNGTSSVVSLLTLLFNINTYKTSLNVSFGSYVVWKLLTLESVFFNVVSFPLKQGLKATGNMRALLKHVTSIDDILNDLHDVVHGKILVPVEERDYCNYICSLYSEMYLKSSCKDLLDEQDTDDVLLQLQLAYSLAPRRSSQALRVLLLQSVLLSEKVVQTLSVVEESAQFQAPDDTTVNGLTAVAVMRCIKNKEKDSALKLLRHYQTEGHYNVLLFSVVYKMITSLPLEWLEGEAATDVEAIAKELRVWIGSNNNGELNDSEKGVLGDKLVAMGKQLGGI